MATNKEFPFSPQCLRNPATLTALVVGVPVFTLIFFVGPSDDVARKSSNFVLFVP
jgi:hypothetical protein